MKAYIVFGTTGEYSDRSEWMVTGYLAEDDAKAHVLKATEHAKAWESFTRTDEFDKISWTQQQELKKSRNPLDSHFNMDYTGTQYSYAEVEIRDSFTFTEPIQ